MKLKPKGRRIYREKSRFERLRAFRRNTGAVVTTLVLVGAVGFVGYSAGGPILRFMQERGLLASPQAPASDETASAENTPAPTDALPDAVEETAEAVPETQAPTEPAPTLSMCGARLRTSDLISESALLRALDEVPAGTTHVFVPLKAAGGGLYYATSMPDAVRSGAVQAAMPLVSIYSSVQARGFTPVAVVDALEDHYYPQSNADAAYHLSGSGDRWLDADPDNGGVPWMSPFSAMTAEYLSGITAEIGEAGFRQIVCEGLVFPAFSQSDAAILDPRCMAPDRYTALMDVADAMREAAPDAEFWIGLDGADALDGQCDALYAAEAMTAPDALLISADPSMAAQEEVLRTLSDAAPCLIEWQGTLPEGAREDGYVLAPLPASEEAQEETQAQTDEMPQDAENDDVQE